MIIKTAFKEYFLLLQSSLNIFNSILLSIISYHFQVYLVTTLSVFSLPKFNRTYRENIWTYILPFLLPMAHVGLMGSTYSTLALAVERYIAVCHPFQARR